MKDNKNLYLLIIGAVIILGICIMLYMFLTNQEPEQDNNGTALIPSPSQQDTDTDQDIDEITSRIPTEFQATLDPSVPVSPYYTDDYLEAQETIAEQEEEKIEQSAQAGDLLDSLPYTANSFSLDYDYSTFQYVLTLPRDNQSQGMEEFELYLEENGIEDPSWLQQLQIEIE